MVDDLPHASADIGKRGPDLGKAPFGRAQPAGAVGKAQRRVRETAVDAAVDRRGSQIDGLGPALDHLRRIEKPAFRQPDRLAGHLDSPRYTAVEPCFRLAEPRDQFGPDGHRHLGGGGRCRGPYVGSEIDQGGVGLVTDGGDHGKAAPGDGANHLLFIKGPEVLERSPAPRHDQQVGSWQRPVLRHRVEPANGASHLAGRLLPLDERSPEQHPHAEPVAQPVQDIADHRPGRAGDDPDHRRHHRERLLAAGIEQSLGGETPAAFLKLSQHRPFAGHFHGLHDDLVFRAAAIDGQLAGDNDLKPLFRLHAEGTGHRLPADGVEGVLLVLQREIQMT